MDVKRGKLEKLTVLSSSSPHLTAASAIEVQFNPASLKISYCSQYADDDPVDLRPVFLGLQPGRAGARPGARQHRGPVRG